MGVRERESERERERETERERGASMENTAAAVVLYVDPVGGC